MTADQIKNTIKTALINDLGQALQQLEKVIKPNSSKKNDLIMQQARFNETRRNVMNGMLASNNAQMTYSHIRNALLYLIDNLEGDDLLEGVTLEAEKQKVTTENSLSNNPVKQETVPPLSGPLKFFISYAREDEAFIQAMKDELIVLQRMKKIEIWDDSRLIVGDEWDKEIKQQLTTADIICLMVSKDFIKSDYIWSTEMEQAIKRHQAGEAVIVPILLKKVAGFSRLPFAKISALPRGLKPISDWDHQEDAWYEVEGEISKLITKLEESRGIT